MPEPLPSRPPVPPCPSNARHLFDDGGRCVRCSRPRRQWSDYDYDGNRLLKRLLYSWLRRQVVDAYVLAELGRSHDADQSHAILEGWRRVSWGGVVGTRTSDRVELWEDPVSSLYLHCEGRSGVFHGLEHAADSWFPEDAVALADDDTAGWTVPYMDPPEGGHPTWPWQAATLVAVWERGRGPRLTPESEDAYGGHPSRSACQYLGIADPNWLGSTRAARMINCDPSHIRRLAVDGVLPGRKGGHDLQVDPLAVRWYASLSRSGRLLAAAHARGRVGKLP